MCSDGTFWKACRAGVLVLTLNELPGPCEDQSTLRALHRYWSGIVSTVDAAETLRSLGNQAMFPTSQDNVASRQVRDGVPVLRINPRACH